MVFLVPFRGFREIEGPRFLEVSSEIDHFVMAFVFALCAFVSFSGHSGASRAHFGAFAGSFGASFEACEGYLGPPSGSFEIVSGPLGAILVALEAILIFLAHLGVLRECDGDRILKDLFIEIVVFILSFRRAKLHGNRVGRGWARTLASTGPLGSPYCERLHQ